MIDTQSLRVMLYVQHLLGVGHLKRCATLADAMTRAGLRVLLVTGGLPVPGLSLNAERVLQLPPAAAGDLGFKSLVDDQGRPVDDAWKARRTDLLLQAWQAWQPQLLLVELFPFGRRQMRFELLPLLQAVRGATPRSVVACSVRDVLGGTRDADRLAWMQQTFDTYFDHLLVHGDARLLPFSQSYALADRLEGRLHYTGYVVESGAAPQPAREPAPAEVLVSAGGGAVGRPLLEAALRARPLTRVAALPWRVLTGVNATDTDFSALQRVAAETAAGPVVLERFRPDFAQRLAQCAVSVSQAGYNTVMEVLRAQARAVVVPFAGGQETEQAERARLLARRGWLEVVEESALAPAPLAAAIDRAAARPHPEVEAGMLEGAVNTAALVARWAAERALAWQGSAAAEEERTS